MVKKAVCAILCAAILSLTVLPVMAAVGDVYNVADVMDYEQGKANDGPVWFLAVRNNFVGGWLELPDIMDDWENMVFNMEEGGYSGFKFIDFSTGSPEFQVEPKAFYDASYVFVAPEAGTVEIADSMVYSRVWADAPGPIDIFVEHNDVELYRTQHFKDGSDDGTFVPGTTLDIQAGDTIRFIVSADASNDVGFHNLVHWINIITYVGGEEAPAAEAEAEAEPDEPVQEEDSAPADTAPVETPPPAAVQDNPKTGVGSGLLVSAILAIFISAVAIYAVKRKAVN